MDYGFQNLARIDAIFLSPYFVLDNEYTIIIEQTWREKKKEVYK